eukprot:399492_1
MHAFTELKKSIAIASILAVLSSTIIPNISVAIDVDIQAQTQTQQQTQKEGSNGNGNGNDPFASLDASLNQMDFGAFGNSGSGNASGNTNNGANSIQMNSNLKEEGKSLSDVVQEKKKQRNVDPRTHG